jgi:hypothetical protein
MILDDSQYLALANTLTPLNWFDTEMECRMKGVSIFIISLWLLTMPHYVSASSKVLAPEKASIT